MIPTAFEYQRATSLDDAVARLQAASGAKLLAGGHSLVPLMKLRLSEPAVLIDVARIPGLSGIKEKDGKIEIGAATTHREVAASALLKQVWPVVADTAIEIGDPQVRNRGTLGGSLAHADPAADYPATMLAVDAEIHIKGPKGWRKVKASDFFQGLFTVDLQPDEIIAGVQFAPVKAAAYAKLHQRASHFAIVGVAAAVEVKGGVFQSARIGLTGASTYATRLTAVEQALAGKPATKETIAAASAVASADDLNSDIHASDEYRRAMVKVFTRRALEEALARV
ncbi:MAG TPA: xanthine dehydrogenase family protein subunit M [Vicinamibacterales bacterium]|nr:xanthine dehydrogenase family protein subunit M [Vicinamibacterales bacterium]